MTELKDLKRYQQSKEYKDILKSCEIRQEELAQEILAEYFNQEEKAIDRTEVYDFHDKQYMYIQFLREMLDRISEKDRWAKALRVEIEKDIRSAEIGITSRAMNEFGIPYSANKLTKMDIKRVRAWNYRTFYTILQGMINEIELKNPNKWNDEVYDN